MRGGLGGKGGLERMWRMWRMFIHTDEQPEKSSWELRHDGT